MSQHLEAFRRKMEQAGQSEAAIAQFLRGLELVDQGVDTSIPEATIESARDLPKVADLDVQADPALLAQSVVIKLNGGLGTGMGLAGPKSLLEVREGQTFLSLIVRQLEKQEQSLGAKGRLLLMNSFSTSSDTMDYLAGIAGGERAEEMLQSMVPKRLVEGGTPAEWTAEPSLEWCPPGHGDLYATLVGSGKLRELLDAGVRYAFVSNSDNLGATLDPEMLTYFAQSGAPMMMEVTRRTAADRKGGHLAVRKSDGRLILRESAQCPDSDVDAFQDIERHRYFNTNNLWLRLDVLEQVMDSHGGLLPLPVMTNRKTVDPRDADSPAVIQLETAMGAAIECFEGAAAIVVGRDRFAPVKTTNDLLGLRSDAYRIDPDGAVRLDPARQGRPPVIDLDSKWYKLVDGFADRFPAKVPSLIDCEALVVKGNLRFTEPVTIQGTVTLRAAGEESADVPAGTYADCDQLV
ncbi:UTP--glucose-1-phosphate uridylyltransferase [Sulfuriroseicoccus oceanibius]|uniref:UTP--glucose-1-phosphate uridylyltransferase n=1 Tax=Sulfuriroseicoccus oceanibius TaxID=2707525 RepID=A0A6B3L8M7_9BACT|nr:UTP--glucose-1-phosphate uridylyltransferase [Sulfuriroseicoccus oceanibius]QQL46272.1 UTP--glucose-1-phosphate uridylyltransferase [Sulfuriroseicoccus oceanibius]